MKGSPTRKAPQTATGSTGSPDAAADRPSCGAAPAPCQARIPGLHRLLLRKLRSPRYLVPPFLLVTVSATFVGGEVLVRLAYPDLPIGYRHLILTLLAAVVTALTTIVIWVFMRRYQARATAMAGQLASVVEAHIKDSRSQARFENPYLVSCREVLDCKDRDCAMCGNALERCWHVTAVTSVEMGRRAPGLEIQKCRECRVYRMSCPDRLTELGESFNNLLFLLDHESGVLKSLREQLVEKEKMVAVGQLAAGVAHEVTNPLSSISSVVQMLQRNGVDKPTEQQLTLIESHIHRITEIVRRLGQLARPDPKEWAPVDLAQEVSEAVRLVSFDRRAQAVEIDFKPSDLPETYGVPGQVVQIVLNLSLNALDAMPDGGRLAIQADSTPAHIVIRIEDTGCGVPAEIGRRVFEPFFTTKDPGQGTGLGLAVTYSIVEELGGTIDLDSKMGRGTVFTVRIPVLTKAPDDNDQRNRTARRA